MWEIMEKHFKPDIKYVAYLNPLTEWSVFRKGKAMGIKIMHESGNLLPAKLDIVRESVCTGDSGFHVINIRKGSGMSSKSVESKLDSERLKDYSQPLVVS